MSLEGLISTSALFHEKDGTATMKVVNAASAESYTSGKIAIVSGTCGTTAASVDFSQFKTAAGEDFDVSAVSSVSRLAFSAMPAGIMETAGKIAAMSAGSKSGEVSVISNPGFSGSAPTSSPSVTVRAISGTASYTVMLLGD
jgi:hypothetical protein